LHSLVLLRLSLLGLKTAFCRGALRTLESLPRLNRSGGGPLTSRLTVPFEGWHTGT
jgi:hypothetical protein